jgi:FKBP-type peptidyl-prolyl cis-trans isomerase
MRPALALLGLLVLVGCDQGYNFDRSVSETQKKIVSRVRPLDTTKPPPKVPLPENPPNQIDIQKVRAESAKITALKIEEVAKGAGPLLEPGKYATVHYVGMLPDGYVFDSTYGKGDAQPYTFLYDPAQPRVIKGWIDGVKGMRVGGHRRLTIPATMAYGGQPPAGSPIPPDAALVFEVQLMFVGDTE